MAIQVKETALAIELGLSRDEWHALRHGMHDWCAIKRALPDYHYDDVSECYLLLMDGNLAPARDRNEQLVRDMLRVAVVNSNYVKEEFALAQCYDDYVQAVRVARSLSNKVSTYVGVRCDAPE